MQNQARDPDGIEVESASALSTISKAEIDIQIATAKKYPRSIEKFQHDALTLATADQETARSCFYVLPRDGKKIEGASVRLAEIAVSSWGNTHAAARVVDIDDKFVTGMALAWDLEKNVRIGIEVKRRITNKYGQRYSDDMITTTANAACAIAFRNAVFKVVPAALIKRVFEEAKSVSLGKGKTMEQRRDLALKLMTSIGAKLPEILIVCGRRGVEDLTVDDLIMLNGIYTAIKENETNWAEVVRDARPAEEKVKTNLDDVADTIVANEPPKNGKAKPEEPAYITLEDQRNLEELIESLGWQPRQVASVIKRYAKVEIDKIKAADLGDLITAIQQGATENG